MLGGARGSEQDRQPHTLGTCETVASLSHIKLHHRACAFNLVAAVTTVPDSGLLLATVQHIILPLSLQALFDHPHVPGKCKVKTLRAHFQEL